MNSASFRAVLLASLLVACHAGRTDRAPRSDLASVRAELERWYALNVQAYRNHDVPAIMALRAPDFHTVTPDGVVRDRAAMEHYITGLLNGIRQWNELKFTIDSLSVRNDTAYAIVSQYLDRMALRPDNQVHHVQTWVTQREIWVRIDGKWLMWRVDGLRNQRRLVDGRPE